MNRCCANASPNDEAFSHIAKIRAQTAMSKLFVSRRPSYRIYTRAVSVDYDKRAAPLFLFVLEHLQELATRRKVVSSFLAKGTDLDCLAFVFDSIFIVAVLDLARV